MSSSGSPSILDTILQAATAIGTIAVAIVAIWGDWIRAYLAPAKLTIEPHNLRGKLTNFTGGRKVIFYHVKVVNHRSWIPAKNCRVILAQVLKRAPNGDFTPVPYSVPMPFVWAPAEITPPLTTVIKEQVVDLGYLAHNEQHFAPRLYSTPNDFKGFVGKNEAVRYHIEIHADGYVSRRDFVVEVAWDGTWSENLDEMSQHLVVKVITP